MVGKSKKLITIVITLIMCMSALTFVASNEADAKVTTDDNPNVTVNLWSTGKTHYGISVAFNTYTPTASTEGYYLRTVGYKWRIGTSLTGMQQSNCIMSTQAHYYFNGANYVQVSIDTAYFGGLNANTKYYISLVFFILPSTVWYPPAVPPADWGSPAYDFFTTYNYPLEVTTNQPPPPPPDDDPTPPPYCFIEGTAIATPTGNKNIEDLNVGDTVLSYNQQTGVVESDNILKTFEHSESEYLLINNLGVTGNHPIYVNGEIIPADRIKFGDTLIGLNGNVEVTSIERIYEMQNVYNLEVTDNHNYFAGGILVHNKGGGGHSCPYIYVWNGSDYVADNSMLTSSEIPENPLGQIYDYHKLQQDSVAVNNTYKFRIMESEDYETSYLDKLELITVDYSGDFNVGVTLTGDILTYGVPEIPLSCTDSNGNDKLSVVQGIDDTYFDGYLNDNLFVNFTNCPGLPAKLVIRSDMKCPGGYWPISTEGLYGPITISIINNDGDWQKVGSIVPRELWANDMLDISSYLPQSSNILTVKLSWASHHKLDYIGLDRTEQGEIEVGTYNLLSANHSLSGDVMEDLTAGDNTYVQLLFGEYVDFEFPCSIQPTLNRDLILYAKGYYTFDSDYTMVEDIDIFQNITVSANIVGTVGNTVGIYSLSQNASGAFKELNTMNVSTIPGLESEASFITRSKIDCNSSLYFVYEPNNPGENLISISLETPYRTQENQLSSLIYTFDISFNANDSTNQKMIIIDDILSDFYDQGALLYYAPSISYLGLIDVVIYDWKINDAMNISYDDSSSIELPVTGPGQYNLTLRLLYEDSFMVVIEKSIILQNRLPQIDISDYQKVDITLEVGGRKDNTIGIRIYEDGTLIQYVDVIRTAGPPNSITIGLNKYTDRVYVIELVYDAEHKGANPTSLTFTSGASAKIFSKVFNTNNGYSQIISVPTLYLDDVAANNPTFWFDASGSYDIDGEIVAYDWDFGDGSISEDMIVEHTFTESGQYTVLFSIEDDYGAIMSESAVVNVDNNR